MRISIITVCYNSEKTIERTIKSVFAPNIDDLEYILVDVKSKNNTVQYNIR
ncbi:MAG: glycosyltransferase [Lachnospiraceae bacterium]|nr:glycosyltransferase [Lachnospiraceae bacterium]